MIEIVNGFENVLAGSHELKELWYITGAEFVFEKNVTIVYIGILDIREKRFYLP